MVALLIVTVILLFLTIDFFVQRATYRRTLAAARANAAELARTRPRAEVDPSALPGDIFMDPTHTWLRVEADGLVSVGASPVALMALGTPDGVELHPPGTVIEAGAPLFTFRSGGRTLTLRAPMGAVVEEVNTEVAAYRELPETLTWLYKVRPRDLNKALPAMTVGEDARAWVAGELHRLRESVLSMLPPSTVGATMLDGGAPADALADCLDEPAWERLCGDLFHGTKETVHGANAREGRLS